MRSCSWIPFAALALALGLAPEAPAALAAPASVGPSGCARSEGPRDQVAELLESGLDRIALARALFALGEAAAPELLAALAERAGAGDEAAGALRDALRSHPRALVVPLLAEQVSQGVARRRAALEVLTSWATAEEIDLLFDLVGPTTPPSGALLRAFEPALCELHERGPEGRRRIVSRTLQAPILVQDRVLRAVRPTRAAHTLELLAAFVEGPELLAQAALRAVGDLWHSNPHLITDEHLERVRDCLDPTRSRPLCSAALVALGQAQDTAAAGRMIELLAGDSRSLSRDAHWALCQATGMTIAARPELWTPWFERECQWWQECSGAAFEALESSEPTRVERALREIAAHRLNRRAMAERVGGVLEAAPVRVAALCCATLAQLGASSAVPALTRRIDDPVPEVREAAHAALVRLTGLELDVDADARDWRDALARTAVD